MSRLFALPLLVLLACGPSGTEIVDQEVTVACGMCRLGLGPAAGCYWAADFGPDKVVPVIGSVLPKDHENHAPDGMCNVKRQATVSGTLYDERFAATKFDLHPVEPAADPEFKTPGH